MIKFGKLNKTDILLLFLLAIGAFSFSLFLESHFPEKIYHVMDMWFGSDVARVLSNMTSRGDELYSHYRTKVHPIFSLLFFPPTKVLMLIGVPARAAANGIIASCAAISLALTYVFCRLITVSIVDSLIVCGVFVSTASFIYWFCVVEAFAPGSTTLSAMLVVSVLAPASLRTWILASAGTLSITVTNWALGLIASFLFNTRKRFFIITICALALVVNFSIWQKAFIRSSELFFLPSAFTEEPDYTYFSKLTDIDWVARRLSNAILFTGVEPKPLAEINNKIKQTIYTGTRRVISSTFYDFDLFSIVAVMFWVALLLNGIWTGWQSRKLHTLFILLGAFSVFQIALGVVYGNEPFLYSAHFLPGFIGIIALGFVGRHIWISRTAGCLFCLFGFISNYTNFLRAIEVAMHLPN